MSEGMIDMASVRMVVESMMEGQVWSTFSGHGRVCNHGSAVVCICQEVSRFERLLNS